MSLSPPTVVAASSAATSVPSPHSAASSFLRGLTGLGLGYAIAVALGVLVLLSSILLASYICCRSRSRSRSPPRNPNPSSNGVTLPRNVFVPDDDDGEDIEGGAGLDPAAINSYPKFSYSKGGGGGGGGENVCSICLCDYKEGEMLRLMPDCRHYFHIMCIDAWLRLNASCPVCRTSPMPTPLSTPLSELVPLSQYSADRRRRR